MRLGLAMRSRLSAQRVGQLSPWRAAIVLSLSPGRTTYSPRAVVATNGDAPRDHAGAQSKRSRGRSGRRPAGPRHAARLLGAPGARRGGFGGGAGGGGARGGGGGARG